MKSKKSTGEFGNCVDIYCLEIPSSYVWGEGVTKSNSSIVDGGNKKSRVIHGLYTGTLQLLTRITSRSAVS